MLGEAVAIIGLQPSEYHALTLAERDAVFDAYRRHEKQRAKRVRV